MEFRAPNDADWQTILSIANRAVAHVDGARTQEGWLRNRRTFSQRGTQVQLVLADNENVVGYGCLEREATSPADGYRVFVVVDPDHLGTTASEIYRRLEELLVERRAKQSWFVEYAQDARFVAFTRARGYIESRRFMLESGQEAIVLTKIHERVR